MYICSDNLNIFGTIPICTNEQNIYTLYILVFLTFVLSTMLNKANILSLSEK